MEDKIIKWWKSLSDNEKDNIIKEIEKYFDDIDERIDNHTYGD